MLTTVEFYRSPAVRQRIKEYCGLSRGALPQEGREEPISAEYLVGYGEAFTARKEPFLSVSKRRFNWILDAGLDIFRSVWDSESTLGILDIEYFNLRYPGEIHYKQQEVFEKVEPVYHLILQVFSQFGLKPLVVMTGQGYHFSFRVQQRSPAHKKLESLGNLLDTLRAKYRSTHGRRTHPVSEESARGFEGMGRILEYLVHLVLRKYQEKKGDIPLVCTDVAVGGKGEAISLDLSMYGDPIYMRDVRCPFSSYQKHKVAKYKYGESTARDIPVQICLPRFTAEREHPLSLEELFSMRRHFANSAAYAESVTTFIPESSSAVEKIISAYETDALCAFHKELDATLAEPPHRWPMSYDRLNLASLPPCLAHSLSLPNDHLLKPTNLQTLVRVLMKMGWHPKHIAGLVRSKYERDYGWGREWFKYDANSRSHFYVRLFAGLIVTKTDQEIDLNCVSHREKGYCWKPFCGFNLANYKLN